MRDTAVSAPLSILVVDDSEADRYLLRRELREAEIDAEVFEAGDGEEAYQILAAFDESRARFGDHFPPAIVFLDVNMPRMNGFEFLEAFTKLREGSDHYDSVVVIVFSSSEFDSERQRAIAFPCVRDFLVKGKTTKEELRAKVEGFAVARG